MARTLVAPAAIITGHVVDPAGQPIAQARVFFTAAPVAVADIAALTNDDGTFTLTAPRTGDYTVTISATAFAPFSTQIAAVESQAVEINVTLERD